MYWKNFSKTICSSKNFFKRYISRKIQSLISLWTLWKCYESDQNSFLLLTSTIHNFFIIHLLCCNLWLYGATIYLLSMVKSIKNSKILSGTYSYTYYYYSRHYAHHFTISWRVYYQTKISSYTQTLEIWPRCNEYFVKFKKNL